MRAWLVVLGGCGRIAFDPLGDGSGDVSHDEDLDGVPDISDVCPHIADSQADTDVDGVGDTCDAETFVANQRWMLFDPMTSATSRFQRSAGWTVEADRWLYADGVDPSQLILDLPLTNVDVWVGVDFGTIGTGGVQAALVIRDAGPAQYYYGELFDAGGDPHLSITEYNSGNYNALTNDSLPAMPAGEATLLLRARSTPSLQFVYTLVGSVSGTTNFATPNYVGGGFLLLGFGNHSGAVRYVAIIGS